MPTYTQADGPLAITTPLGKDVLLLTGIRGYEAISQLFNFQLDLLAEVKSEVHFDAILGQNVTVTMGLPNGEQRCFNGMVKRFSQSSRDETFVGFRAEVVPQLWLLTKKVQSRTFQHLSVPDILHQVFSGLDVTYEILATYYQRDFCVQYRESDFDFVSRLMEEEGIYYFFKHSDGSHQMVVTDVPNQHPEVPIQSNAIYEPASGAVREDMHITTWEKTQELRAGEYTLWDHCFELPGNHLEAKEKTVDSVAVGEVTHKLKVGGNDQLEIYDYPGGYAQRFDGIDRNGEPRPQDLQCIFRDNQRTARVRMEQEDAASLEIAGTSDCGHFVAGHKFTLQHHFDGNGEYLLTRIEHDAHLDGDCRSYQEMTFKYGNRFDCIPVTLPYRPQRVTQRPTIAGIQTATVVGPSGEEIFCDKYGRVKVQFNWDREGKKDANSSCWLRVAQVWAGNGWGAFFWPRIGHEVVVIFEEGDPDQPVIIGSVYNAENMPPYGLPTNNQLGGLKSCSVRGRAQQNFNGVVFDDTKGHEHLGIHSERHMSFNSEFDKVFHAGRHKGESVTAANVFTVGGLPGAGGGSGGGFDDGDATPMTHPGPAEVPGLNSVWTFGENLQVAVGLNHQLALGNNLQICINPLGLFAGVPEIPVAQILTGAFGSGIGGNMQFTIGSSAQFVLGQEFDINIGPPKITVTAGPGNDGDWGLHVATEILCGVLGATTMIWALLYGTDTNNFHRANESFIFQLIVDALLVAVMEVELDIKKGNRGTDKSLDDLYRSSADFKDYDKTHDALSSFGVLCGIGAAAILPIARTLEEE
jgi:type VI secretion system secreted protein VgrG